VKNGGCDGDQSCSNDGICDANAIWSAEVGVEVAFWFVPAHVTCFLDEPDSCPLYMPTSSSQAPFD